MSREIGFTVTDEEYAIIASHVARKHRWARVSQFLRDACFQSINHNPAGRHDSAPKSHGGASTADSASGKDEG